MIHPIDDFRQKIIALFYFTRIIHTLEKIQKRFEPGFMRFIGLPWLKKVNRGNPGNHENPGSEWKNVWIVETVISCTIIIYLYSEKIYEFIGLVETNSMLLFKDFRINYLLYL